MENLEKRVSGNLSEQIWKTELSSFEKIAKKLRKPKNYRVSAILGADPYVQKNKNGEEIIYLESKVFKKDILKCGVVEILYKKDEGTIGYYIKSDETGTLLLGEVGKDKMNFPIYGEVKERDALSQIGEMPVEEIEGDIRATIAKIISSHPIMGKYAGIILGDFDQILSMDKERPNINNLRKQIAEVDKLAELGESELTPIKKKGFKEFIKNLADKLMGKGENNGRL